MANLSSFMTGFREGRALVNDMVTRRLQTQRLDQEKSRLKMEQKAEEQKLERFSRADGAFTLFQEQVGSLDDKDPGFVDAYFEAVQAHGPDISQDADVYRQFTMFDKTVQQKAAFDRGVAARNATRAADAKMAEAFAWAQLENPDKAYDFDDPQQRSEVWQGYKGHLKKAEEDRLRLEGKLGARTGNMTESQRKAFQFSERLDHTRKVFEKLENEGFDSTGLWAQFGPTWLQSSEGKQYRSARDAWVNAVLRSESGAAVPISEYEAAYKQYFPQFNDSKENIENKRRLRERAERAMKLSSGAYDVNGNLITGVDIQDSGGFDAALDPVQGPSRERLTFSSEEELYAAEDQLFEQHGGKPVSIMLNGVPATFTPSASGETAAAEDPPMETRDDLVAADTELYQIQADLEAAQERLRRSPGPARGGGSLRRGTPGMTSEDRQLLKAEVERLKARQKQLREKIIGGSTAVTGKVL